MAQASKENIGLVLILTITASYGQPPERYPDQIPPDPTRPLLGRRFSPALSKAVHDPGKPDTFKAMTSD